MMRKIFITVVLSISANLAMVQQGYFSFIIHGKHGFSNYSAEMIKSIYFSAQVIQGKNQIYLQNFGAKPDNTFNTKTGTKKFYESVYNN